MFVKLSCKIADRLEHCGIISKSNRTLYEYGLRQMFATILNILTMLLIGFIMGLAVPAMVYTIAYIPLRVYAGGYHASTPQRCWAFSAIMLWIALCIVKYTPQMYFWCSLPRKTQKTDTQNEKNAPEHHVQERFLLPINGVLPLFYPFNFSSILATCRKICLSVSLLLVSFSVSSFGLSVVVVAFFANPFSPAALMIAG